MKAEKYNEAAARARKEAEAHPDCALFRVLQSMALLSMGKPGKAAKVLEQTVSRFPDEPACHSFLSQAYAGMGRWTDAEAAGRRAIELAAGANPDERAHMHYSLGEVLRSQDRHDEAFEEWNRAITIDPQCQNAKDALAEYASEHGAANAHLDAFDGFRQFREIHQKRYFNLAGHSTFETKEEAERVFALISDAWNAQIAHRGKSLDTMNSREKSDLFSSVTVDFSGSGKLSHPPARLAPAIAGMERPLKDNIAEMDGLFPYLPPGEAMMVMFALHAFEHAGLRPNRLNEILEGAVQTEDERDMIIWGHELVLTVIFALENEGTSVEVEAMMEAVEVASERFTPGEAGAHVRAIREVLKDEVFKRTSGSRSPKKWKKLKTGNSSVDAWFARNHRLIRNVEEAIERSFASSFGDDEIPQAGTYSPQYTLAMQLAEAIKSVPAGDARELLVDMLFMESSNDMRTWLNDLPFELDNVEMTEQAIHMQQVWAEITDREDFLCNHLLLLAENGMEKEAEELSDQLVRRFPNDPYVRQRIGEAYLAFGDFELAERQFRKALDLSTDPDERESVLEVLIPLLEDLGRKKEAKEFKKMRRENI